MSKPPPPAGLLPLLTILFSNGILAATMYLPSLPAIGGQLEAPAEVLPLTLTVYFITFAGGQLIYGPLSDRYGRRPLLLGGLAIMIAGSVACALSESLSALLWSRAMQGLGAASAMATGRAIINDVYDRTKAARATSVVSASLAIAPIVAPMLGGLVEHYLGWRANFWISGIVTLVVALLLLRRLPETHPPTGETGSLLRGIMQSYAFLLGSRAFLTLGLLNLGIFAGLHSFNASAPAVLIGSMGVTPINYGLLIALGSAGFLAGALISARLGGRLGLLRLIDLGVICMLAGAGGLWIWAELFGDSILVIVAMRVLWAVGMGLALPNSAVVAIGVNPATLGAGAALSGFLQTAGGGLGSAVTALFPAGDDAALAVVFVLTALFCAVVWWSNRAAAAQAATSH